MKKIVPFKKDIIFKTNLSEVTSISLEHTLHVANQMITGEFIVSGDYRMAETSTNTESFNFNLPFDINFDDQYIIDRAQIDIDDFYYEIINNNVLSIHIEVAVDKLEEKPLMEPVITVSELSKVEEMEEQTAVREEKEEEIMEEEMQMEVEAIPLKSEMKFAEPVIKEEKKSIYKEEKAEAPIRTIFDDFDDSRETYCSYKVYIVREGDNLEGIMQKYGIAKEELDHYNDLSELKIGDKIIIPALMDAKN